MSHDSDTAVVGRALTEETKRRHAFWKESNTNLIRSAGLTFTSANNGEALLFRSVGKPSVDFYPSTGRWLLTGTGRVMSGGAQQFLRWYEAAR